MIKDRENPDDHVSDSYSNTSTVYSYKDNPENSSAEMMQPMCSSRNLPSEFMNQQTRIPSTDSSQSDEVMNDAFLFCSESESDIFHTPEPKTKKKKLSSEERLQRDASLHPVRVEACQCRHLKCSSNVSNEMQKRINAEYWSLDCTNRKRFVHNAIDRSEPERSRPRTKHSQARNQSRKYHLLIDGKRTQVCKKFFMNTLGYTSDAFITTVCKGPSTPPPDKRGRHTPVHAYSHEDIEDVENHIESFNPTLPHYRRAHAPNRRYLPSDVTVKELYNDYKEKQMNINKKPVNYQRYLKAIHDKNISFSKLGTNECETCVEFENHHHEDELNCRKCKEWKEHNENGKLARRQYMADAIDEDEGILYISSDMQKTILLPRMDGTKQCQFTSRLVVFHQTFAPIGSKSSRSERQHRVFSCIWHEGIAGRSAADVASAYERARFDLVNLDNCTFSDLERVKKIFHMLHGNYLQT